jgi:hypothetical protein
MKDQVCSENSLSMICFLIAFGVVCAINSSTLEIYPKFDSQDNLIVYISSFLLINHIWNRYKSYIGFPCKSYIENGKPGIRADFLYRICIGENVNLQFFYIFCGGKKFKKKANLVRKKLFKKHFFYENVFLQNFKILNFLHIFSKNKNILKTNVRKISAINLL